MSSGNTEIHKANDIQIAFFDVDGTLVDINTKVATPKMLDTLRALQKNGVKICIATGRARSDDTLGQSNSRALSCKTEYLPLHTLHPFSV